MRSIFNKITDEQWQALNDEQGWSNKGAKAYKKELDKLIAEDQLRQQTEMFWFLQMQFMSMDPGSEAFYNIIWGIYYSPVYKDNKFTKKIKKLMFNRRWKIDNWTEDDFACLCAHFALQLSGIEE